jgi:uncharacterized protein (TIGR00730 family)
MMNFCVFCGSNQVERQIFLNSAYALGTDIARINGHLVYGGSNRSMMGRIADGVMENGGKVTAVITDYLLQSCGHKEGTDLIVVDTMAERKQKMFELSDAFIALRGGFGTYDEIFEMLVLAQLNQHLKPCAFLNINNSFKHLIHDLDEAAKDGFISKDHREMAFFTDNNKTLLDYCIKYTPKKSSKF